MKKKAISLVTKIEQAEREIALLQADLPLQTAKIKDRVKVDIADGKFWFSVSRHAKVLFGDKGLKGYCHKQGIAYDTIQYLVRVYKLSIGKTSVRQAAKISWLPRIQKAITSHLRGKDKKSLYEWLEGEIS